MLAPLSWLRDYNEINLPVDQLVKTMILSGTAVEGYEQFGAEIENVVVGKVLKIEKHPDADHLFVCQVDIGEKQLQICTAAKNLYPGALVPVALHGARLAGGIKIKNTKMRGLASEGMFCSYEELGVPHEVYPAAASDGILIFEEDYPLGTDVKTIFNLDDILIDFDILSNRPDCQSIIGVSREIAAALGGTVAEQIPIVNQPAQGDVHQYIQVRVDNQQLCPRFCGKIVKNVKVGPSPLWLRNRLNEVGIRPINNIVDITNYVMVEYGQPMHAYDLTDIRGGQIIVRNAQAGETIRTLDGKDRALVESMLVIADAQGATGVAGIMGGENSEIKETTATIFLEAACFDFASVRVSAKKSCRCVRGFGAV
jgi:phenylalanyl-tRNA synthetase beta chain